MTTAKKTMSEIESYYIMFYDARVCFVHENNCLLFSCLILKNVLHTGDLMRVTYLLKNELFKKNFDSYWLVVPTGNSIAGIFRLD